MPNELNLIEWIRARVASDARTLVGIGDDCAVIDTDGGPLLITVDMLLEGVHFDLSGCTANQVGRKAMAVNLSDIAAMAGVPTVAVVAVGLPESSTNALSRDLFRGMQDLASEFGVVIVGGDTNVSKGGLVVSVTLLGRPTGRGPVLRRGAQPGDWLCVTGTLGYSILGKHLEFVPRIRESQHLHDQYPLTSMIDLSDGLGADLYHLTDESRCGAIVEAAAIPVARVSMADDTRTPLDHALNDGEDFELLFTLPGEAGDRLIAEQPLRAFGVAVTKIGWITEAAEVLIDDGGKRRPLARGGFQHRW
jgi:thiamine-monophosphate kinase